MDDDQFDRDTINEAHVNAEDRLTAAAPEMLELLYIAANVIEGIRDRTARMQHLMDDVDTLITKIKS